MQLSGRPLLDNAADQRLFVGRAGEVDRIERSIGAGLNCLITGVAGSGKTSLVRALMFRAHLAGRPGPMHYVRGGQAHTAAELLAEVAGAVRGLVRPTDTVGATDPLARLDEVAEALAAETESDGTESDGTESDGTVGDRFRPPPRSW